jgi:uncharacterized membrane protein YbhN (UPF0104 family)
VAAVYYFTKHHNLLTSLKHISPVVIVEVFALYVLMLGVLVVVYEATMGLVRIKLKYKENWLINSYSLFINFFVPGQAGPAFRAYYMKKNHGLKYLDYTVATIIYYLVYGILSLIFVLAGSQPYFIALPAILAIILVGIISLVLYLKRKKESRLNLSPRAVIFLIGATLSQVVLQTIIYFVELHSVKPGMPINNVITYAGTANLALFVALTPGAIGIREGFLILTHRLNHLAVGTIVLANVIDRSVYIIFLLALGAVIAVLKVREKLGVARKS